MKKQANWLAISILFLLISSPAGASLFDRGNGLIYDDDLDITWLSDANFAQTSGGDADGRMSWSQANDWISNLSYGGGDNWRLPTADSTCTTDVNCINSEMGHLFYSELSGVAWNSVTTSGDPDLALFSNIGLGQSWYWTSTPSSTHSGASWTFNFNYGWQDELYNYSNQPVWAVHDGDIGAPVPLPAAVWFFGSGLAGLFTIRRKKN